MGPQRQLRRALWKWLVPAVGVAALGLAAYAYFHTPRARTYRLTMTAGSPAGERHHLAETLVQRLHLYRIGCHSPPPCVSSPRWIVMSPNTVLARTATCSSAGPGAPLASRPL